MASFTVNDKPAVKIFAKSLVDKPENNAILFDCEGDKVWLPRSTVNVINRETRQIIQHVCDTALYNTNIFYASIKDKVEEEQPEPKKKGGRKKVLLVGAGEVAKEEVKRSVIEH